MKLNIYLKQQQISQSEFAQAVGVTQGYISQVIAGNYIPKGRKAIEWASKTNWLVTPHDLNPIDYPNPYDGLPKEPSVLQLSD
ncbi:helix-turn-helix domain-containing protein [Providencia sp. wls1922]|uniref:helix-turn-helix domain-containing protein n=1 Tax=Providencia sp. wls1922 TaxID=2675152 RepID=UPI0012B65591|nr:helix-turn-helix transcriptional regulator [Providencia sp. wls1922]MTC47386.1 helix-turn-helix domain-containing protein [Providencia sp. wls1922]